MATDSFKFWDSYLDACDDYTDEEFGALIRAIAKAVFRGEQPDFSGKNKYLKSTFKVMLAQAVQSRKITATARENGRKSSGRPRKNQPETNRFNEKKREEEKGTESSSLTRNPTVAPGGVLAPPPAPDDAPPPLP